MMQKHPSLPPDVIFEDNHIIAVNKRPSEIVQGDKTGDLPLSELLKIYIAKKYNKPGEAFLGVVHRIDRPVSGIVIFARTSKALSRLNEMLRDHLIKKTYWAIVKEKPPKDSDRLVHFILRKEKENKSYIAHENAKDALRSELSYKVISSSERYYLLEVELHTGRHHQIRAQLAAIGCPIKGDLKYGYSRSNPDASICLHARRVSFIHPVKKEEVVLTAQPPDDKLWNFFVANTL
ncbi:MAG: RNA pseudouridine synthase [Bacteroidota bacterium]